MMQNDNLPWFCQKIHRPVFNLPRDGFIPLDCVSFWWTGYGNKIVTLKDTAQWEICFQSNDKGMFHVQKQQPIRIQKGSRIFSLSLSNSVRDKSGIQ